jgi:hypothetical protein
MFPPDANVHCPILQGPCVLRGSLLDGGEGEEAEEREIANNIFPIRIAMGVVAVCVSRLPPVPPKPHLWTRHCAHNLI